MSILTHINASVRQGRALLAQLIDPDDVKEFDQLADAVRNAMSAGVDYLFVGGSLIVGGPGFDVVKAVKEMCSVPVITFPSTPMQLHASADGVLLLSLISGRNPEYLIGQHVHAAPLLRKLPCEILPTGYMLVECGATTTAQYISHSQALPYHKPEIAAATALAGEQLGLKLLYLDGGSGAEKPISTAMVRAVKEWTRLPLIVGGGICDASVAASLYEAGADMIVVGNAAWKKPGLIKALAKLKNAS